MAQSTSTRAAWVGLVVLTLVWSFTWIVMKAALREAGPFTFSAHRYVIGTIVLFVLMAARRTNLRPTPWLPTLVIGLAQTCAFQALSQLALVTGGVGKVVLLAYSMPFWVVPLAWWWLHEKPGLRRWVCTTVAAVGFVVVVAPWQGLGTPLSIAFALAAGAAWAVATVVSKGLFQRHPEITPLRLTAWQMLVGTLGLVVLALIAHERPVTWNAIYIGSILYTGLLSTSLGWVLWALIVQRLPTSVAGMTSLAVPMMGVLFAWALLREAPSGMEWIGIGLIGVALLALNLWTRHGRRARRPQA